MGNANRKPTSINARRGTANEPLTSLDVAREPRTADSESVRVQALVDSLSDAVLIVDRAGRTTLRNEAFVRMFEGVEARDEGGRRIPVEELRERTARGETTIVPFSVAQDGKRRWFEASILPVPPAMGLGDGGMLVVRDTTDVSMRRLQEEFVGIVAHELRTPLTALRGYVQMLQRATTQAPDPRLELIVAQADRLEQMVDELFDLTLVDRGRLTIRPARLALGPLVHETVEIARALTDRQEFRIEGADDELIVDADGARIQQLLLNLLTNATVHASDSPDVVVRLRRLGRRAEIQVEDRGPGIPRDLQAEMFNRFERGGAARRGLGLGLFISREIALAHRGTIEVDSEPGKGTTFTVRLPLAGTGKSPAPQGRSKNSRG